MVRRTYTGVHDARREFEALGAAVEHLRRLQFNCRPFGPDYHALDVAIEGLRTAAFHFTKDPSIYSTRGDAR